MSGALRSLRRSCTLSNGKPSSSRSRPILPSLGKRMGTLVNNDKEEKNEMVTATWSPPPTWATEIDDFTTTEENFGWRKNRAVMTLKYLMNETVELVEQPSQYIYDIRWFRYLSSIKHCKIQNPLGTQADFVQLGLPQLFKRFWTDHLCIDSMKKWSAVHKDSIEALYHMTMALWFISSNPEHRLNLFSELCQFIMAVIASEGFERNYTKDKRVQDCLKALLGIIFQFVKHIDHAKDTVRANRGMEYLRRITSNKSGFTRNVKGRALMVLAYVFTEKEQKEVNSSHTIIEFLVRLLKDCLTTEDHRSTTTNYDALEILCGLNRLAMSDGNKDTIHESGGISLYLKLLETGSLQEQEEACKGLWTLCFSELVSTHVLKNNNALQVLRSLAKSEHDVLRSAAAGCLWTMQESKKHRENFTAANKAGHIMISYSWAVKTQAKELKQRLHDRGYRVWMDVDNMSGSTLSSMSQAIERSAVVLVLLSEHYKSSPACRAEAEYAYKLRRDLIPLKIQPQYNADGWLGMLIGMKMFFDLTDHTAKESAYHQLFNALGEKGKGPPINYSAEVEKPKAEVLPPPAAVNADVGVRTPQVSVKELECVTWSEEDIGQWIANKRLQDFSVALGGEISGDVLMEMKYMLERDTHHYYDITRKDLKLPTLVLLRLSAALRRLK